MRIFLACVCLIFCGAVSFYPLDAGGGVAAEATWRHLAAPKEALFKAAKTILRLQGFEIERLDEAAGILKTALSPMRLNLSGCDCGVGGGGAEQDTRPILLVGVAVAVDDNRISIGATIEGEYPEGQVPPAIIEDDLFNQIAQYLK